MVQTRNESLLTVLLTVWCFVDGEMAGGMQDRTGAEQWPGCLPVDNFTRQTAHLTETMDLRERELLATELVVQLGSIEGFARLKG